MFSILDPFPLIGEGVNSAFLLLSISGVGLLVLISAVVFFISRRYTHKLTFKPAIRLLFNTAFIGPHQNLHLQIVCYVYLSIEESEL